MLEMNMDSLLEILAMINIKERQVNMFFRQKLVSHMLPQHPIKQNFK
jgi:hypothetical protein